MADQNQSCPLNSPCWTDIEKKLKNFLSSQCQNENFYLLQAIQQRMQDSSLGIFLYNLNQTQQQHNYIQQDKLERFQFDMDKGLVDIKELERFNDVCDDIIGLIELCLRNSSTGKITLKKVLGNINILRLIGSRITTMDDTLHKLGKLEALVLAGNCLSSCPSSSLPRGLMILELCCNKLEDISSLADDPPPHLLYLGVARNYLTDYCDVFEPLKNFQYLFHLDLAHNNIQDMSGLVLACSQLENLTSLMLIGNPCSMSSNYSIFIQENLQKLVFLDGEMLKKQVNNVNDELGCEQYLLGTLQIRLYRVMGLPQPTNEKINKKKVTHSFRLEMEPSLLHSYLPQRQDSFITDETLVQREEEVKKEPDKKGGKAKSENKKNDETSKSKKQSEKSDLKKGKKKKISEDRKIEEEKEDVDSKEKQEAQMYELLLKSDQIPPQESFKSERKNWGKIIEFNEPTIEVSNCDLWGLRDVFRTNLTLRIVHLKTLPPVSKGKKNKKPKKQDKNKPSDIPPNEDEDNREILVSKSTLAKIKLPLQDILWNNQYLDYSWTITKPFTAEHTTGLKDLHYVIKKKKEPKNKKGKVEVTTGELEIPSDLTCHIGVGVKREEPSGVTQQL